MAYRAEIEVAVKGAAQLQTFQGKLERTALAVDKLNQELESFVKGAGGIPRSVQNLNLQLSKAAENFNEVALGTDEARTAAIEYAEATKNLNQGLAERAALLKEVVESERKAGLATKGIRETTQFAGPIGPGAASSVLGGQSMPIGGRTERLLQAQRETKELKQALLRLDQKSFRLENERVENLGRGKQTVAEVIRAVKTGPKLPPGFDFKKGELQTKVKLAEDASIKQINQRRQQERQILSAQIDGDLKAAKQRLDSNTRVFNDFMNKNKVAIDDFDRRLAASDQKRQQASAQRSQRIGNAASSALIGGAFPLLFGQGGAAAAGGAVGGLAGGLVGGQFGFALSLVGTALGDAASKAEKFNQDLAALNARAINLGSSSLATAKNVGELARQLGKTKDETIEVLQQFSAFTEFADRASLARVFGGDASAAERLAASQTEADLAQAILDARGKIGIEESQRLLNQLKIQESTVVELAFVEALAQKEHEITVEKARQITLLDRFLAASASSAFDVVDPAIFGEERAEKLIKEFEANRASLRDDTLKNLESLRELFATAASFDPSEPGKQGRRSRVPDLNAQIALEERLLTLNNQIAQAKRNEDPVTASLLQKEVVREQAAAKLAIIDAQRIPAVEKVLEKQLLQLQTDQQILAIENRLKDIDAAKAEKAQDTIDGLLAEQALLQATLEGRREEEELNQRVAQIMKDNPKLEEEKVRKILEGSEAIREQISLQDQMARVYENIGMSIKTGVVDSISAAVDGTKSLAEVASNTLKNIANQLLNIGVNFALFGVPFGKGIGGGLLGGLFANGGRPPVGKPSIVGERGPELFVPRSSGTIVPNHALGGSANVTVNVDASGSSVEGSANEAAQLGKAIGLAVQQELIKQKRPGGLLTT